MQQASPQNKNNETIEVQPQTQLFQRTFGIHTKSKKFIDQPQPDDSRNIFLQEEKQGKTTPQSNKKTKKLKIFGISENKINKQSFQIPDFFEIQEVKKEEAPKDVQTPVLFESKIDIHLDNGLKASKEQGSNNIDQNQKRKVLQRLLELSQSSASVVKLSEPSQSQHSVQTNEIDQLLKIQIMEKSYLKPHNSEVSNSNKRVLKVTESQFVEIEEEEEKKEQNVEEAKKQQNSQVVLPDKEEKVKQVNVLLKQRRPSSISQQESNQKKPQLSYLKYQKVQCLQKADFILQTTPQKIHKDIQKIKRTKKTIKQQYFPQKNIKNYLQQSKDYDKDIQKMIEKFQKVSSLKSKQKNISKELNKLNSQKKCLSDRQRSPIYICPQNTNKQAYQIRSQSSEIQQQSREDHIFAKSTNNFRNSDNSLVSPERILQEQLKKDVRKMQKIIDRFKVISQYISKDTQVKSKSRQPKTQLQKMQENPKVESAEMMNHINQIESFFRSSNDNRNLNQTEQLVDSGVYKTIKIPKTERINQISQDYKNISLKTQKKFSNTVTDKPPMPQEIQYPCTHEKIVQQIKKLKQKIEKMQSNKFDPQKIETTNKNFNKIRDKLSLDQQVVDDRDRLYMQAHGAHHQNCQRHILKKQSILPQKLVLQKQKKENSFEETIDLTSLQINFPNICTFLAPTSSESAVVAFGETLFARLLQFASLRKIQLNNQGKKKIHFKIKKYEDCIHFHTKYPQKYHLVYYYKGKIYFGDWKDSKQGGFKHGFGYFFSPNKYVYEGQFQFDKKNGKGTINYLNGEMYSGEWMHNKKQGEGVLINSLGDIYKGSFANGKKNGYGEEKLKNGDFYRGMFKDGKLDGQGIYWWANGSVYKGSFRSGLLYGKGIWKSKQNDCYEGEYRNNKKYGYGTYRWSNGMIFNGYFKEDDTFGQRKTPAQHEANLQGKKSISGGKHRKSQKIINQDNHHLHKQA